MKQRPRIPFKGTFRTRRHDISFVSSHCFSVHPQTRSLVSSCFIVYSISISRAYHLNRLLLISNNIPLHLNLKRPLCYAVPHTRPPRSFAFLLQRHARRCELSLAFVSFFPSRRLLAPSDRSQDIFACLHDRARRHQSDQSDEHYAPVESLENQATQSLHQLLGAEDTKRGEHTEYVHVHNAKCAYDAAMVPLLVAPLCVDLPRSHEANHD